MSKKEDQIDEKSEEIVEESQQEQPNNNCLSMLMNFHVDQLHLTRKSISNIY